jgi:gluconate 2-dehydrogenase gamma chain
MSDGPKVTRRRVLGGISLLPLATMLPDLLAAGRAAQAAGSWLFFSAHQAAVVDDATARMIPGLEDPIEGAIGSPGARDANVTRYIDTMLAAFTPAVPRIHAGGPWSNRHGGTTDYMANFVPLTTPEVKAWKTKIADLQKQYTDGVKALDSSAGGDFTAVPGLIQDQALGQNAAFRDLLMAHAIEGCYSVPEYGGNQATKIWVDIQFPGDVQPRGYTPSEVSAQNAPGSDVMGTDVANFIKKQLPAAVPMVGSSMAGRRVRRDG